MSALFHIAQTTEPPVMPPQLSKEGCNFLLRCFNRHASWLRQTPELCMRGFLALQTSFATLLTLMRLSSQ